MKTCRLPALAALAAFLVTPAHAEPASLADGTAYTTLSIGGAAPNFEGPTLTGDATRLSDYEGKVVLLDFWATWCGPCVHEMPNVIAAYEKFNAKGFEILGVSLDDGSEEVQAFVDKRPGMTWNVIVEAKGWSSAIGELYGVDAIPATFLIGPDGTIIGKDLRGEELEVAIAKALDATTND